MSNEWHADNHGGDARRAESARIRRKLLQFAAVGVLAGILVLLGPGLGSLRSQLRRASAGWLAAAVALEVLSALSYVLVFRVVFCRRMSWKLSYQIAMAQQGANSVLSVSGAGGLAQGAWALRRGGMSTEYIARGTVAFFFLTSLANVVTLFVFAALYAVGILQHDRDALLTYGFGAAALVATAIVVLGLPRLRKAAPLPPGARLGRVARARRFVRDSLGQGVRDALLLLRERPVAVLIGSFGVMGFDIAVLSVAGVVKQRRYLERVQDEWRFVGLAPLASVQLSGKDKGGTRFGKMVEKAWNKLLRLH